MISSSFSHGVLPLLRSLRIAKNGGGYTQRGVAKGLKVPCLFMITEVSIRCQKNPEVGIRRIPAYTPPPIHHWIRRTVYGMLSCVLRRTFVFIFAQKKLKSNPVSWITSLPTVYSILTSQLTADITPLKQLFCASTITSSVQWDHRMIVPLPTRPLCRFRHY